MALETRVPGGLQVSNIADSSAPPLVSPKTLPTSLDESVEEDSADNALHIAHAKGPTALSKENDDVSHRSNSTTQLATPLVARESGLSMAQGRHRSNTAFRVRSGNIPIIYVEGEEKQLLDLEEVERKHLQPLAA